MVVPGLRRESRERDKLDAEADIRGLLTFSADPAEPIDATDAPCAEWEATEGLPSECAFLELPSPLLPPLLPRTRRRLLPHIRRNTSMMAAGWALRRNKSVTILKTLGSKVTPDN